MNFEKFTDRARGFVQSAQSLALREGHQQFAPDHLLKVLLDDPEGLAAGLIDRSGGKAKLGVKFISLASVKFPAWDADKLPKHLKGTKGIKPGSRGLA